MSNYCKGCRYKVSKKSGEEACPFNYLYWEFLIRNEKQLRGNHRLNMVYSNLDKQGKERRQEIKADAKKFLKKLDKGDYV
jgi:deoxyribodipyrimidine photolyase-related protein